VVANGIAIDMFRMLCLPLLCAALLHNLVGAVTCRKRYESRFQTEVHSELLGRLCLGNVVVDREIITGQSAMLQ
jgi:hypothetical protein